MPAPRRRIEHRVRTDLETGRVVLLFYTADREAYEVAIISYTDEEAKRLIQDVTDGVERLACLRVSSAKK